jgi:hypothetical protein
MRLALLREGIEEWELLQMLADKIGRAATEQIVAPICQDLREFTRDPNRIDQVRETVIQRILQNETD